MRRGAVLLATALLLAGCGGATVPPAKQRRAGGGDAHALLAEMRPIGRGPRFEPPLPGRLSGACTRPLGERRQAHIELFGADRVVLLPAGLGTRAPRRFSDGRLTRARCFADVVTLDPTGTVYFRGATTVGDIFRLWGQPLSGRRIASFAGGRVRVYVDGHLWHGPPRRVPLTADAEIVLEVGPRVPPHTRFSFLPAPSPALA